MVLPRPGVQAKRSQQLQRQQHLCLYSEWVEGEGLRRRGCCCPVHPTQFLATGSLNFRGHSTCVSSAVLCLEHCSMCTEVDVCMLCTVWCGVWCGVMWGGVGWGGVGWGGVGWGVVWCDVMSDCGVIT